MLYTEKIHVKDLVPNDAFQIKYEQIESDEEWKVALIKEIIQEKQEQIQIPNFTSSDLEELLTFLCTG